MLARLDIIVQQDYNIMSCIPYTAVSSRGETAIDFQGDYSN